MKKDTSRVQPIKNAPSAFDFEQPVRAVLWAAALLLAIGCGAAHAPEPTALFVALQRDEARLARGAATLDAAQSCEAGRSGADAVCDARRDLCERVQHSQDADAQTRCLRAADLCISARARADATCADSHPPAGP